MAQTKPGQPQTRRLGDLLVAEGLLTEAQLKQALSEQKGKADKLGSILVRHGFITEEQLIGFLSRQYGIPSITLNKVDIDAETLRLVPSTIALKYEVLPVKRIGGTLTLAMADPTNVFALDDIAFMTNLQILPVVAPQAAIRKALETYYEAPSSSMSDMLTEITAEAGNVEVVEGNAESVPLPDASADVVTSNGVLNLVPDKAKAFAEIFRVLRSGGRIQIAEELHQAGREVHLAISNCPGVPRRYRGRDVIWWLLQSFLHGDEVGVHFPTVDDLPSPAARFGCFPHLSGKDGGHDISLRRLARQGVRLYGRLESASGSEYYACAAADRIVMDPAGDIRLMGTSTSVLSFGDTLRKIGVRADFVRIGPYKSAPEQFTQNAMSEPAREEANALLDDPLLGTVGVHRRGDVGVPRDHPPRCGGLAARGPGPTGRVHGHWPHQATRRRAARTERLDRHAGRMPGRSGVLHPLIHRPAL